MKNILALILAVTVVFTTSSKAHGLVVYNWASNLNEDDVDAKIYSSEFTKLSCTIMILTIVWIPVCILGEEGKSNSLSMDDAKAQGYSADEAQALKTELDQLSKALTEKKAKMVLKKHESVEQIKASLNGVFNLSDLTANYLSDISGR